MSKGGFETRPYIFHFRFAEKRKDSIVYYYDIAMRLHGVCLR